MNIKKILFIIVILILIPGLCLASCCYLPLKIQKGNGVDKDTQEDLQLTEEMEFTGIPNAVFMSNLKIPGLAIDVDISGNYAYLTNDLGVLYIIDITDKENPSVIGKCPGVQSANIIIADGDYAYISYYYFNRDDETDNEGYTDCGIYIVDISKKDAPVVVGNYNTGEGNIKYVYGMYIEGDYAYISTSAEGSGFEVSRLEIVDISNKKAPSASGWYEMLGIPSGIWVEDNTVYVNVNFYDYKNNEYAGQSKLLIIDTNYKEEPRLLSYCEILSNAWGIYVLENRAYISSWKWDKESEKYTDSLFQVVDAGDTSSPELIGNCVVPGGAWELDSAGGFIYVSSLSGGIYVVDISEGNNPVIVDGLKTFGTSCDITISGNYGYIADGLEGMSIAVLSDEYSRKEDFYVDDWPDTNFPPEAVIEIFGDILEGNYQTETPVYFSAQKSYDPDEDDITYRWLIDDIEYSSEESFFHYFEGPDEYDVRLIVNDGEENSEAEETIIVSEKISPIASKVDHTFIVEIEYSLINNGPGSLKDIECLMRIPQTYYPFQIITEYKPNNENTVEVFDNEWNVLVKFEYADELLEGESLTASIEADVTVCEFNYLDFNGTEQDYSKDERDIEKYTADDLFIDSDNPVISNTAKSLIKDETNSVEIAKIIYDFVIRNLDYDYFRAEDRNYELLYASEILERGEGVCADYAILYTALLRSAGIPARLAAGIPVYTILYEKNKEIDIGHAWVEIKIPNYGWIPIDITVEDDFMAGNYYLDITTERGPGYLYENMTMDWTSYYYDGFSFFWSGPDVPDTEQTFVYRVLDLGLEDIVLD